MRRLFSFALTLAWLPTAPVFSQEPDPAAGLLGVWRTPKRAAEPEQVMEITKDGQVLWKSPAGDKAGLFRFEQGKLRFLFQGHPAGEAAFDGTTLQVADPVSRKTMAFTKAPRPGQAEAKEEHTAPGPKPPLDPRKLGPLFKGLGAESFSIRQKAQAALQQLAKDHPQELKKAALGELAATKDAEVRARLRSVLFRLAQPELQGQPQTFLGILMQSSGVANPNGAFERGVMVQRVVPGTAAERAGLQPGDIILRMDGKPFANENNPLTELQSHVKSLRPGSELELKVRRGENDEVLKAKLGQRPLEYAEPKLPAEEADAFAKWLAAEEKKIPKP